jgi:hypothetical protein
VIQQTIISDEIFNLYLGAVLKKHDLMPSKEKHFLYYQSYHLYRNIAHSFLDMIQYTDEKFCRECAVEQFIASGLSTPKSIHVLNEFLDLLINQNCNNYVEFSEPAD